MLDAARRDIEALDREIVRLAAERVRRARAAGDEKTRQGLPTVDFARERLVLDRGRQAAREAGLDLRVAEEILARLVEASVTVQERDRVARAASGRGRRAVVVGGAGRMGRWLRRFLEASGHQVESVDPALPAEENDRGERLLADADLVLVATPPTVAARLYDAWARRPPRGVVADLCSIKAPLAAAVGRLRRAGGRVASFHPLFGPDTLLLRDADVLLCDTGDAEALEAVRRLFAPTTARLLSVALEEHDRLVADVLNLAHATALAFAAAVGEARPAVRSTTFRRLEELASRVVEESPQVYFEIQAGNPDGSAALDRLQESLARLRGLVASGDGDGFASFMAEGRRRLQARRGEVPA